MRSLVPVLAFCLAACAASPEPDARPAPGERLLRLGDEISVCGELFHTGTRVVLWNDPGGYDAYRVEPRFEAESRPGREPPEGARYGTRRQLPDAIAERVAAQGWNLLDLAQVVDQFVLHYDVAGTSRQCFKILQDLRGLSVHFLLDVDGTIYQCLDLKERGWHATIANDRSIGVEIAQIGAYPKSKLATLADWYGQDADGPYLRFPAWIKETGIRTRGFVGRPASPGLAEGVIQGRRLYQYDYTDAQYDALAKLVAALARVFPRLAIDYPRDADGTLRRVVFEPEEFEAFSGLLGHFHVQKNKVDPGPAFDWDRLVAEARAQAGR